MITTHRFFAAGVLALVLALSFVAVAGAAPASFPHVSVSGGVGFVQAGVEGFASFNARAIGPVMGEEDHQPARGFLDYRDETGLTFTVSVEHIHVHSATEVHFGGTIVTSSDPLMVGMFAHAAAVDGGSPGTNGDMFSILWTADTVGEPAPPVAVTSGNLVVKTS